MTYAVGCSDEQYKKIIMGRLRDIVKLRITGIDTDDDEDGLSMLDVGMGVVSLITEDKMSETNIMRKLRKIIFGRDGEMAVKAYWELSKALNS